MPQLELTRLDLPPQHLKTLQTLLAQYTPTATVWAYGSRVNGQSHETSDLDLVLRNPLNLKQSVEGFFDLREALQDSSLPILVDIHDWAHLPQTFHQNIQSEYVVVQAGESLGMAGDWATVPLSELTSAPPTYGVVQPGQDTAGGTPMLRVNNFQGHSLNLSEVMRIAPEVEGKYGRTRLQSGDVLLTIVGSVGQVAVVPDDLSGWNIARAIAMIRPNKSELSRWISLVLRSPQAQYQLGVTANTTVQTTINLKDLRELRIPLPEDRERAAIAHILGTLDDKIELNRKQNETLEAMARALFKAWFVDFEPVRAKIDGRWQRGQSLPGLPAHLYDLFPERLDEEGKPEGWESVRLDDALVLQRGFDLPASARTHGTYPVMAASGINGYHDKYMVKGPGITTGRSGVLGSVFLVHSDFWPLNTSLWVKEFKRVSPYYAFELLRGLDFEMFNAGSAVPTLNRNHVHNLPITLPPSQLIDVFDGQVMPMRTAQQKNEDECDFLAKLRDTLLPKLISGELRIVDAERFIARSA